MLAHEVAHHKKNHLIVKFLASSAKNFFMNVIKPAPSFLEMLFGIEKEPLWWKILNFGANVLLNKTIFVSEEREADVYAIELLKKANLPVTGAYHFFKKLEERSDFLEKLYLRFIDEHPTAESRLKNIVRHYPEIAEQVGDLTLLDTH